MPDLGNSRRKLKIAIGVMLAVDVVAVAVLFSPLVGSADSRQLQLNLLRVELTKKNHAVEPLRGQGLAAGQRTGQAGFRKWGPHPPDELQGRTSGRLGHCPRGSPGQLFRRLSATGALHQYTGTLDDVFYGG